MIARLFFFTSMLAALSFTSSASLPSESQLKELSQDSQWLHLLHYHQAGLFSSFESQIDDPDFFLSPEGKTNPLAELHATIQAFKNNNNFHNNAICRFPARFAWIRSQLTDTRYPELACEEFTAWFNNIDAKGLTLIFPAAYLNSPSSMFGHTFIRLNRASGSNALLDYSVNFAANADPNDNELVFSYKGLTGGYPGVYSILPYYEKVKEYSYLESRDVWEYTLSMTPEEVNQFVRHIWEVRNIRLDYFFFSENCSYQILTILDAASPRFDFASQFHLSAKPADTVRVIEQAGLIEQTEFRPSTQSSMNHMLNQLTPELKDKALDLVHTQIPVHTQLENLDSQAQSQVLELAYQYNRYLAVRKKQKSKSQSKRAISLLSARSKLSDKEVFAPYPSPEYRDDQGHRSHRLESTIGHDGDNSYAQFGLRLAYHDRLDTAPGYVQGAKLEIFNATLRHTFVNKDVTGARLPQDDSTQLQALHLIDIASFSPRNDFITPTSWRVSTGIKRPMSAPDELSPYLSAGGGLSYMFNDQQFYALLDGEINLDNDISKGYRLATGPHLGWLSQHDKWSVNLDYSRFYDVAGADFKESKVTLGLSRSISKNWQLRATSIYNEFWSPLTDKKRYTQTNALSLMYYY